ncbi:chitinase [Microsporum canis CBS 113480]|uniref:Chitinase n=1 Tax=Arthroderma otae (strain ATCC MYA-4605 / CBS 113480) TaxID=554155 RepID=C5FEP8_ARTOC|nr:chitinase [Microsporum canis CBS 113480]EEQ28372.1 chitinase [Microsporum canis CBS 113480]
MRSVTAALLWASSLAHAAINLDGSHATKPLSKDDPSPIGDPTTYYPDQHDCPLPCVDYANTHSWIPYFSVARLHRCHEPMLLQFSITQPLDDSASTILIRSCNAGNASSPAILRAAKPVPNPKHSKDLFQRSLETAPACITTGTEVPEKLQLAVGNGTEQDNSGERYGGHIGGLLDNMEKFFSAKDNCDENVLFSYHNKTVVSVYIGSGLGKATAQSALKALASRLRNGDTVSNVVVQLCGRGRQPERVFGISIDTTGNLAAVQKAALEWSKGKCVLDLESVGELTGAKVMDIVGTIGNTTTVSHRDTHKSRRLLRTIHNLLHRSFLGKRDAHRQIQVMPGDSCSSLAIRCKISSYDFLQYNPKPNLCSTGLQVGSYVWCSAGDQHEPPKPPALQARNGDTCDAIARKNSTEIKKISGPPSAFQRIGYYEAYGLKCDCLWLKAKDANTNSSYTHIHWGFAGIEPDTWKPVIMEGKRAARNWKGACFFGPVRELSNSEFAVKVKAARITSTVANNAMTRTYALVTVTSRPEFLFDSWEQSANPPFNDGLNDNPCWPSGIAAADPGFALLTYDPYYNGQLPPYNYRIPYVKGSNGS